MTTETTDPLETVMAAADKVLAHAEACVESGHTHSVMTCALVKRERERLRLHLQLALAKARYFSVLEARDACWESSSCTPCAMVEDAVIEAKEEIAALETRLPSAPAEAGQEE